MIFDLCDFTTPLDIFACFNTYTANLFWMFAWLFSIFILLFEFRHSEIQENLLATFAIASVAAILLRAMEFVNESVVITSIIITAGSLAMTLYFRRG